MATLIIVIVVMIVIMIAIITVIILDITLFEDARAEHADLAEDAPTEERFHLVLHNLSLEEKLLGPYRSKVYRVEGLRSEFWVALFRRIECETETFQSFFGGSWCISYRTWS